MYERHLRSFVSGMVIWGGVEVRQYDKDVLLGDIVVLSMDWGVFSSGL